MASATDNSKPDPIGVRVIGYISTICGVIASFMILASVFITCQMIFVRFVLERSTIWQTEAVIYLMIAATLLGLPYVQKLRGHVGVDLVPLMLPPKMRKILLVGTLVATALMMAAMLFYGWEMFHFAYVRGWKSETVWAIDLWIPYLFVPLGFGLFLLQLIADIWQAVFGPVAIEVTLEDRRH